MADPAKKLEELPESALRPVAEEEGVILSPEEEVWFDEMMAEADEEERAGRLIPVGEIRAKLRAA